MALVKEIVETKLHFRFTESGFILDERDDAVHNEAVASWKDRFQTDGWQALYDIGFQECPDWLDPAGRFLYQTADRFQWLMTHQPDLEIARESVEISVDEDTALRLLNSVPFTLGAEYVTVNWIGSAFSQLKAVFVREISFYEGTVALYLSGKSQQLRVPERIFFHLVESKEEDFPFAFLATYATKTATGKIKHLPLKYALTEYKAKREKLLELLSCLNQASDVSPLIREFVESGEMFHALRLTSDEAYQFLKDVPAIEASGIVCRVPNWWRKQSTNLSVSVNIGEEKPPMVGVDAILSMVPQLTADGVPLTKEDIEALLAQTEGLAFLKGKWVEVDHSRLKIMLEEMEKYKGEISLLDALRMGCDLNREKSAADVGPIISNGKWLSGLLADLRSPKRIRSAVVPKSLHATLRPYQKSGYTWLNYMNQLHFGACLADDMGLGKTVQVLTFLEHLRKTNIKGRVLLVVPASLLGNWQKESAKFAPEITVTILHGSGAKTLGEIVLNDTNFLTITTYGMVSRIEQLQQIVWDCIVLDEAQAIKNPTTNQTKQVKKLTGNMRIAMTGTPIENDLGNLWSLFDFLNKGLLGSSNEFHEYCKQLEENPEGYAKLKAMITPFMLRRVKTDKTIISDLPEKMEQIDYVTLSKKQVVLYRRYVAELAEKIEGAKGMSRKGLVLASLSKLKQICNHPDQYLGQSAYEQKDSGKFEMLRDLCETIYEKRERVLIFTQFKEIAPYLDQFLKGIFHTSGFILHGGTPVGTRNKMVEAFQGEAYVPYMILSVRAGGTGLNLTRASHVIHFDRWWNPAVENQATDRAYRIGQKNNVMVHKLVCKGTIEEKIDAMIESKKELAANVIGSSGENWITEMSNEELLSILTLD